MTMTTPASIPASAEQTPVHTIADILRAMAHDPAIAKAVRQHVLDEELRQLPAAFRQLAATVEEYMVQTNRILADLQTGQARHDADIAELKDGQARLEAGQARHENAIAELKDGQARLEAGQARHDTAIAELKIGQDELRAKATITDARKMVGRICDLANLRRPRFLESTDVFDIFDDADTSHIPPNELLSCQETDLVVRAVSKDDQSRHYVLLECSAGITAADIRRLRRNADLFTRLTGCTTHAVAVGKLPPGRILASARGQNVHCLEPTAKVTRPT